MNLDTQAAALVSAISAAIADVDDAEKVTVVKTDPRRIGKVDLSAGAIAVMPAPDIESVAPAAVKITWTALVVVNARVGWDRIAVLLDALVQLHDRGYDLEGVAVPYELPDVGEIPTYALTLTEELTI